MRELVTVQVGAFANFIGSHFWNFQDELLGLNGDPIYKNLPIDMDIIYRAGETPQGIATYTPRLLSIGYQGSLGPLNFSGSLCDNTSSSDHVGNITWNGDISRLIAEPHKKNLFLQSLYEEQHEALSDSRKNRQVQDKDLVDCLQDGVKYWTDYSKVQYHPRSLYEVHGSWMEAQKFNDYGMGRDILEGMQLEEMNERLRYLVEECDYMQGFQFVADDSGGFSSIAAEVLEHIADEYTHTPVLLYSSRDPSSYTSPNNQRSSMRRALHDAVSFSRLSSSCKLMVPVGLPSLSRLSTSLHVDDQKVFHSSAVYAASMHAMSMPFRMQTVSPAASTACMSGAMDLGELVHILAGQARQNMVICLDVAMPLPHLTGELDQGTFLRNLHPLTPELNESVEDLQAVESLVIAGAFCSGAKRATVSQVENSVVAAYQDGPFKPLLSHLSVSLCPLPIPMPFPSIFGSCVGQHGELLHEPSRGPAAQGSLEVNSVPLATRLRSSSSIMPYIQRRLDGLRRYGIARGGASGSQLLNDWGIGKDEVEDMGEHLSKLLMAFGSHSEMSSDSD